MKKMYRVFIAMFLMFVLVGIFATVASARNEDSISTSGCGWITASGTNRSNSCNNLELGSRRGNVSFSHQQFNLSTRGFNVRLGGHSSGGLAISVCNGVTSRNSAAVRAGSDITVTRGRVALVRPFSIGRMGT